MDGTKVENWNNMELEMKKKRIIQKDTRSMEILNQKVKIRYEERFGWMDSRCGIIK